MQIQHELAAAKGQWLVERLHWTRRNPRGSHVTKSFGACRYACGVSTNNYYGRGSAGNPKEAISVTLLGVVSLQSVVSWPRLADTEIWNLRHLCSRPNHLHGTRHVPAVLKIASLSIGLLRATAWPPPHAHSRRLPQMILPILHLQPSDAMQEKNIS